MTKLKVICKAVLCNGDKVLTLKRGSTAPKRPNEWDLPGGYVDEGEDYREACAREILEETGLKIESNKLHLAHAQSQTDNNYGHVSLLIFIGKANSVDIKLSHEHKDVSWVSLDKAIEQETHPLHLKALNYIRDNNLIP